VIAFFWNEADLVAGKPFKVFSGPWADGGLKDGDKFVGQGAGKGNLKTEATTRSLWEDMQVSGQVVRTQTTEFSDGHTEKYVYYWLNW
jgi:hypothetical protein